MLKAHTQTAGLAEPRVGTRPASYDKRVALVLQGGGALGSYQAGVYQSITESDYEPDWIAGVSIGSINAAIIAGNAQTRRIDALREFWETVTASWPVGPWIGCGVLNEMHRHASGWSALMFGQPGFFRPRSPLAWLGGSSLVSVYDTGALKKTLERLVDFDRINRREMRLSMGAVNVRTGNHVYFDNTERVIGPAHVMASGALPPGFPPVEIDGEWYWDGGLVSNTPLQYVLEDYPRRSRLTFQVDLFPSRGPVPSTFEQVSERAKEIRYSSRTRMGTNTFRAMHDIRYNLTALLEQIPASLRQDPSVEFLRTVACVTTMDVVQLIYRPDEKEGASKDYQFSRPIMEARWAQGIADSRSALLVAPWLEAAPPTVGARVFDVAWDLRTARSERLD
jgi:NTE family protein